MATAQLNQSFREEEHEDDEYGDEMDANIFDATKVPHAAYERPENSHIYQHRNQPDLAHELGGLV